MKQAWTLKAGILTWLWAPKMFSNHNSYWVCDNSYWSCAVGTCSDAHLQIRKLRRGKTKLNHPVTQLHMRKPVQSDFRTQDLDSGPSSTHSLDGSICPCWYCFCFILGTPIYCWWLWAREKLIDAKWAKKKKGNLISFHWNIGNFGDYLTL